MAKNVLLTNGLKVEILNAKHEIKGKLEQGWRPIRDKKGNIAFIDDDKKFNENALYLLKELPNSSGILDMKNESKKLF